MLAKVEPSRPPFNLEAEQALLGAVLLNADAYERVSALLRPEDFSEGLHARIYEACGHLIEQKRRPTPFNLKGYFEGETIIDGVSVGQYLGRLVTIGTTAAGAYDYALTVRDLARRRALFQLGGWLQEASAALAISLQGISAELVTAADSLLDGAGGTSKRVSAGRAAENVLTALQGPDDRQAIPTGLIDLDKLTGGYYRGELTVIAARPSMGKTCFGCSTLLQIAKRGFGVGYFSLEMTAEALTQRLLSDLVYNSQTPIPYVDIRARRVPDYAVPRLQDAAEQLKALPFEIDATPNLTCAEIGAKAKHWAQAMQRAGKELSVIVVDHMGKMKPSGRYQGNKVAETGETSGALAALAKDLDVPVLLLCQLSRQVEGRENKRPTLADLRWAGEIEQDADAVMFLYRSAYYLEREHYDDGEAEAARQEKLKAVRTDLEILVEKQRSGPCGTVRAFCEVASNVVRDRA